jgi:hypothetical protein
MGSDDGWCGQLATNPYPYCIQKMKMAIRNFFFRAFSCFSRQELHARGASIGKSDDVVWVEDGTLPRASIAIP